MDRKGVIVVVEVRSRIRGPGEGHPPESSITHAKRERMLAVAGDLSRRYHRTSGRPMPVRLDVIAVDWPAKGGRPDIRHYPDAVRRPV